MMKTELLLHLFCFLHQEKLGYSWDWNWLVERWFDSNPGCNFCYLWYFTCIKFESHRDAIWNCLLDILCFFQYRKEYAYVCYLFCPAGNSWDIAKASLNPKGMAQLSLVKNTDKQLLLMFLKVRLKVHHSGSFKPIRTNSLPSDVP